MNSIFRFTCEIKSFALMLQFSQIGIVLSKTVNLKLFLNFKEYQGHLFWKFESKYFFSVSFRSLNFFLLSVGYVSSF